MKRTIIFLFILTSAGIGMLAALSKGYVRFNYPSYTKFPVRGIDVSHHQKDINWNEINKELVHFAFIKATEGGDFKDTKFLMNWNAAKNEGIDVGAYHFFTFCTSGKKQAKNFTETVPREKCSLPPVIDLEFGGNCKLTKSKQEIINEIDTLERELFKHFEKRPILYVTKEFYNQFLIGKFKKNPIWIRDVYKKPALKDNRAWMFWQYGNRGHLKGIDTYVDLNVFNGTRDEYEQWKK